MSEMFTASNGLMVRVEPDDDIFVSHAEEPFVDFGHNSLATVALREFFMHEAGIWRDEVTGALVVRMPGRDDQHGRAVCVVTDHGSSNFWEHLEGGKQLAPIAARYYAAHPEVAL